MERWFAWIGSNNGLVERKPGSARIHADLWLVMRDLDRHVLKVSFLNVESIHNF